MSVIPLRGLDLVYFTFDQEISHGKLVAISVIVYERFFYMQHEKVAHFESDFAVKRKHENPFPLKYERK